MRGAIFMKLGRAPATASSLIFSVGIARTGELMDDSWTWIEVERSTHPFEVVVFPSPGRG
jgi:hypothetical protein